MSSMKGPLARLDRSKEELAKAWLLRVIERASLDEIRGLPTDRIASELPELIGDVLRAVSNGNPAAPLDEEARTRAAGLAALRAGSESSVGDLARDVAALQSVLVRAMAGELAESDHEAFVDAVERLSDATGVVQAAALEELVRSRSRELETQANSDPLTGLHNVRYLQRELGQLLDLHKRYGHAFALLVLDIDGLKRVNDAYGHQAGDRILMQVAMSIRRSIRSVDTGARMGGDEFCVLAPEQDAAGGVAAAERLAAAIREEVVTPDAPSVGVSIGVAACPEHGEQSETLMEVADRAMYQAKAAGDTVAVGEVAGRAPVEEAKR